MLQMQQHTKQIPVFFFTALLQPHAHISIHHICIYIYIFITTRVEIFVFQGPKEPLKALSSLRQREEKRSNILDSGMQH